MPAQAPAPAAQVGAPSVDAGGNAPASGDGSLEQLRNHPAFANLQRLVQQNPQQLPNVLRHLESTNPQLFALINQNPDGFVAMLNEPIAQPAAGAGQGAGAPAAPAAPAVGAPAIGAPGAPGAPG